jgi:cellulose synthase (UDP-forming)
MTLRGLWQDIGAGENVVTKILRVLFLLFATGVFFFLAILPLGWPQQAVCGLLTLLMALALSRISDSYLITLALMMMSIFCTLHSALWLLARHPGHSLLPQSLGTLAGRRCVVHLRPAAG